MLDEVIIVYGGNECEMQVCVFNKRNGRWSIGVFWWQGKSMVRLPLKTTKGK